MCPTFASIWLNFRNLVSGTLQKQCLPHRGHTVLIRKYVAVLSLHQTWDQNGCWESGCVDKLPEVHVFKGEEYHYKNLQRVLRLTYSLGRHLWALSRRLYISWPGEPEAWGWAQGQSKSCQFHSQVQVLSLTASRNIALDRGGCFTAVGCTTMS